MKGEELPYAIAKEVFYLDSVNRIINLVHHRSKNIEDWDIEDYLDSLLEDTMDWVNSNPDTISRIKTTNHISKITQITDDVLIPSLVLASLKRHEKPEDYPPVDPKTA